MGRGSTLALLLPSGGHRPALSPPRHQTGLVMPGRPHLSAPSTGIGIVLGVLVRVVAVTVMLVVRAIFPILLTPSLVEGNRLGGELRSVWPPLLCW